MTIRSYSVSVEGTVPLLFGNVAYCDPLGPHHRKKTFFTDKKGRAKTDSVNRAIRVLDWLYSCYWKQEGEVEVDEAANEVSFEGFATPYMPGANFQRCLKEVGKKYRLGKDVSRAVIVHNNPDLIYEGPTEAREMFNCRAPKFQLCAFTKRGIWVNRLCVPAGWQVTFYLDLDDEMLGSDVFRRLCHLAGKAEGLGTWRPRYGRFRVLEIAELDGFAADYAHA